MSRRRRLQVGALSHFAVASIIAITGSCGPEVDDEEEDEPPGVLEFEHPEDKFYRLGKRVDIVPVDPEHSTRECGFLTARAHDDLLTTLEALDPTVDYDEALRCPETSHPKGRVHLEGFEHSPFACDWTCCHQDLSRVALVYFLVENAFVGIELTIDDDDEPYIAIEPDRPCG